MFFLAIPFIAQLVGASCAAEVAEIPAATLAEGAACACGQLASQYRNLTLYGNSTGYAEQSINYWDKRSNLSPGCIFLPTDKDQVAKAISIFASCGTQFAVRGGGHMNFPGSNSIDGGVTLSLTTMRDIKIADDNSTVEVGPGSRWVDVYGALSDYGLYAIGGRMKTIGVSGLELIGGFHYLNNKYGMAMDNVVSYDVVLGNGTQVTADAILNPDLFWALKGGANNFGIVTKFVLKAYPIPLISTTYQSYNESHFEDLMVAATEFTIHNDPDIAAGTVINVSYNSTNREYSALLLGVQEGTESPPSKFANFSSIPSTSTSNNVMPPVDWHNTLVTPNQMFRVQFAHKTIVPDAEQLQRIFASWKESIAKLNVAGLYSTFVLNPLPKSALSVAKNNGVGNVWGLEDDQSYLLWQLVNTWDNAEDDLQLTNYARSFIDYWHQDSQDKGLSSEFLYMGDAAEFQYPFAGFPLENVNRMRNVRAAYDPLGVFTQLNWGGFKLA